MSKLAPNIKVIFSNLSVNIHYEISKEFMSLIKGDDIDDLKQALDLIRETSGCLCVVVSTKSTDRKPMLHLIYDNNSNNAFADIIANGMENSFISIMELMQSKDFTKERLQRKIKKLENQISTKTSTRLNHFDV